MKQWFSDNSDKVLLFALILLFFAGSFVSMKFSNQTILGAALDNMKFVLGALIGLITGKLISKSDQPPSGPPPVPGV